MMIPVDHSPKPSESKNSLTSGAARALTFFRSVPASPQKKSARQKSEGKTMSNSITPKLWKTFDYALCKTAGAAFHAVQFFNSFRPNATFTSLLLRAACYSHWDMNSDIGF